MKNKKNTIILLSIITLILIFLIYPKNEKIISNFWDKNTCNRNVPESIFTNSEVINDHSFILNS